MTWLTNRINRNYLNFAVLCISIVSVFGLHTVSALNLSNFAVSKGTPAACTPAQESDPTKYKCQLICKPDTPPSTPCQDPSISCSADNCDLISKYLGPAINVFSAAFAVIAVISLILGGINYTTSEGDPQKVARAKVRIRNTIFAVVAYIFLYAFLQFLVPGGIFK